MIEKNYVYELANGKKLTKNEFISYFENKVFKTIKTHNLIKQNEKICVALSGGKDSITTLFLLHKFLKKRNLEKNIFAILIDEGISNYREYTINFAKNFCKKLEVELNIQSYKKNFKTSQDENVKILKEKNKNISPCNICGTFRRALLNKFARELKADKIATGHNLDDESQTIMLNIFKNNFKISIIFSFSSFFEVSCFVVILSIKLFNPTINEFNCSSNIFVFFDILSIVILFNSFIFSNSFVIISLSLFVSILNSSIISNLNFSKVLFSDWLFFNSFNWFFKDKFSSLKFVIVFFGINS